MGGRIIKVHLAFHDLISIPPPTRTRGNDMGIEMSKNDSQTILSPAPEERGKELGVRMSKVIVSYILGLTWGCIN